MASQHMRVKCLTRDFWNCRNVKHKINHMMRRISSIRVSKKLGSRSQETLLQGMQVWSMRRFPPVGSHDPFAFLVISNGVNSEIRIHGYDCGLPVMMLGFQIHDCARAPGQAVKRSWAVWAFESTTFIDVGL